MAEYATRSLYIPPRTWGARAHNS